MQCYRLAQLEYLCFENTNPLGSGFEEGVAAVISPTMLRRLQGSGSELLQFTNMREISLQQTH